MIPEALNPADSKQTVAAVDHLPLALMSDLPESLA